jgi:hypothetical protein
MSSSIWPLQFECEVFDVFKKFYKFHNIGILSQDPFNEKNFNPLILSNIRVGFEP